MATIIFDKTFEEEAKGLGLCTQSLKPMLEKHMDSCKEGFTVVEDLGRTAKIEQPSSALYAGLGKIHVLNRNDPNFDKKLVEAWLRTEKLYYRTSDTYFVYAQNYENENEYLFLAIIFPAHEKFNIRISGLRYLQPLIDRANEYNGM